MFVSMFLDTHYFVVVFSLNYTQLCDIDTNYELLIILKGFFFN